MAESMTNKTAMEEPGIGPPDKLLCFSGPWFRLLQNEVGDGSAEVCQLVRPQLGLCSHTSLDRSV